MDTTGLEPVTPTMSTWCSNQLSYASAAIYNVSTIAHKKANTFAGQSIVPKRSGSTVRESGLFW